MNIPKNFNDIEYDGFWFFPQSNEENSHVDYEIHFFKFKEDVDNSPKIEYNEMGDKYHTVFIDFDENGIKIEDTFEALFIDPFVYIKNLIGSHLFGCMIRKTEKSTEWLKDYLTNITENANIGLKSLHKG